MKLKALLVCPLLPWVLACTSESDPTPPPEEDPPTIEILQPTGELEVRRGQEVDFEAVAASDAGAGALKIIWSSDLDGVLLLGAADQDGVTGLSTGALSVGSHTIVVEAIDAEDRRASDSVAVVVTGPPTITLRGPMAGQRVVEGSTRFEVLVADVEDEARSLLVTMSSSLDGELCSPIPDAEGYATCDAILSLGNHTLTFTVVDSDEQMASAELALAVVPARVSDADGDGYTQKEGDCDDQDPDRFPGQSEAANGVDDDCDGAIDEGAVAQDDDLDGYTEAMGDCDDSNILVFPGATETCNEVDDDCDGAIDEEVQTTFFADVDADGYGDAASSLQACAAPLGYVQDSTDCDDNNLDSRPGGAESCDGADNDCDGLTDEVDSIGCIMYRSDSDRDGYGSTLGRCLCQPSGTFDVTNSTDCYDLNDEAHPNQTTFFSADRGDGSFDFNCDTLERQSAPDSYACVAIGSSSVNWTEGWLGAIPACGESGSWASGCIAAGSDCVAPTVLVRTQSCR